MASDRRVPARLRIGFAGAAALAAFVALAAAAELYFRCCTAPLQSARDLHPDAALGWDSIPAIAPLAGNGGATPTVYFVGDSFTQGRRWPAAAQRECARLGVRFDGFTLGVSGYGTTQEWLKIERHFDEHRPALVVLQFFAWNDMRDNTAYPPIAYSPVVFDRPFLVERDRRFALAAPEPPSRLESAIASTEIWRRVFFKATARADSWLARAAVDTLARRRFGGPVNYTERATWEPFYRPDIPEGAYVSSAYAATREAFRRLAAFLRERHSDLLVVGLDNPFTVDEDVRKEWIRPDMPFDPGRPLARLAEILRDERIAFVDARPALLALARRTGRKVYNPPAGELSAHLEPEADDEFGAAAAQGLVGRLQSKGGRR